MNDLLFQLEMDVKDSIMYMNSLCFGITCRHDLNKQILQLKQENTILEEANARYSKLQLIEAEVPYSFFSFIVQIGGIIALKFLGSLYALLFF